MTEILEPTISQTLLISIAALFIMVIIKTDIL